MTRPLQITLITAQEVVEQFFGNDASGKPRVSEGLLYKLARRGELPCVRVGSRVLFKPDDVAGFIEEGGCPSRNGARTRGKRGRDATTNTTTSFKSRDGRAKDRQERAVLDELMQLSEPEEPTTNRSRLVLHRGGA